jgi:hypothetical protein
MDFVILLLKYGIISHADEYTNASEADQWMMLDDLLHESEGMI